MCGGPLKNMQHIIYLSGSVHQSWKMAYVGIKKEPTTRGHTIIVIV